MNEELKVGDVFFGTHETNTAFCRKKIHRVIDGQDWFMYDMPIREYDIVEYQILGVLEKKLDGEWCPDEDYNLITEFHVKSTRNGNATTFTCDKEWFYGTERMNFKTLEEAMSHKEKLDEEAKEMDKK